ncbi:ABC transporter permease [Leucobacter komagatae]|uniref:ABC3 transporter permease C-terminal domain-containing protein n=1 Tax=Leucobacter komagatae TaxID=55969 RepID=A0A0D0I0Z2_9MICO|nr:FtsX-like permease family protein [Leucobacter komagatae]KIP53421.1 hypothetical protein SD72_04205 [Leucobacter komagatae]
MKTLTLSAVLAGRERGGSRRLAGIVLGVAVGVALLLLVLAAHSALGDRAARTTWPLGDHMTAADREIPLTDDTVFVSATGYYGEPDDYFEGTAIQRVMIAATPGSTVAVPGVGAPPRPGEFYASPALQQLLAETPSDQLGDRYGNLVGTIEPAGLLGPEQLLAVVGATVDEVAAYRGAAVREELTGSTYPNQNYQIIAIVGGIAVLFPVVVLISIVTKLGQAARTERFATIRLIGAEPRLVAKLAGLEALLPALVGAVAGIALFFALRPLAALVPIEGSRFYVTDLSVPWLVAAGVACGTAALAALVAYLTALRADLGPLGGSRDQRERAPRWYSLVPLCIGAGVLTAQAVMVTLGLPVPMPSVLILGGFVLVTIGLLVAGPYIARLVSRVGVARTKGAASLLAMSRIARHPRAVFRSVSGLMLALFVVTVFAVGSTTEEEPVIADAPASELVPLDALVMGLGAGIDVTAAETRQALAADVAALSEVEGVARTILVYWTDADVPSRDGFVMTAGDARSLGLRVAEGEEGRLLVDSAYFAGYATGVPAETSPVTAAEEVAAYPSLAVVVADGSPGSLERARTAVVASDIPLAGAPATRAEGADAASTSWAARYSSLAWVGIVIATLISVVSLAISTIASMLDRKRVLGLLRLSGMPAATLRRMILVETALPLASVFLLTIGLGFVAAWAVVVGLSGGYRDVRLPDASYLGLLGICFALAAIAILVVFRSVRAELPLAATRFE